MNTSKKRSPPEPSSSRPAVTANQYTPAATPTAASADTRWPNKSPGDGAAGSGPPPVRRSSASAARTARRASSTVPTAARGTVSRSRTSRRGVGEPPSPDS